MFRFKREDRIQSIVDSDQWNNSILTRKKLIISSANHMTESSMSKNRRKKRSKQRGTELSTINKEYTQLKGLNTVPKK